MNLKTAGEILKDAMGYPSEWGEEIDAIERAVKLLRDAQLYVCHETCDLGAHSKLCQSISEEIAEDIE